MAHPGPTAAGITHDAGITPDAVAATATSAHCSSACAIVPLYPSDDTPPTSPPSAPDPIDASPAGSAHAAPPRRAAAQLLAHPRVDHSQLRIRRRQPAPEPRRKRQQPRHPRRRLGVPRVRLDAAHATCAAHTTALVMSAQRRSSAGGLGIARTAKPWF